MTKAEIKAPEKIYLQVCGDCPAVDCHNCKFEDLEDNITWCKDQIFEKDVEYTRTDAFIEKACEYLDPILTEYAGFYVGGDILQYFKNYMKG